jgi:CubicO group peptidase (beta-lactamase class C family)
MVVVHKGKIAYQYGDPSELSYLASVRKSILAILYGKHVEAGTIDLSTTIGELGIDDNLGLLPIEKQATIEHLITARSGIYHPAANGGYDMSFAQMRGAFQPGENFVYNNWDFNVAGHVFERYTQQSIYQEIEQQLAIPLGFQDWHIDNQKKYHKDSQSKYPAYHIYLSTRDLAKVGQLMLQKGKWGDQQIISKSWIEKITTPVTTHAEVLSRGMKSLGYQPDYTYSYMWWTFENMHGDLSVPGSYSATGWGGHFLTVIPSMDLVIAHKGDLNFLEMWGLVDGGVNDETYYYMLHLLTSSKK